ncbi:hypothetical protein AAC387_Pa05g0842 [Persea americana]
MAEGGQGGRGHNNQLGEIQLRVLSNSENNGGGDNKKSAKNPTESRPNSLPTSLQVGVKRDRNGVSKKSNGSDGKESKDGDQEYETHIWTERERRKKMRSMFSNLHALLPKLPPKADKSTIVDEAVNYIKTLQNILQKLQKQRLKWMQRSSTINYDASMVVPPTTMSKSKEAYLVDQASSSNWATMSLHDGLLIPCKLQCLQTWSSPNVVLSVSGDDAQISICIARKPGLLPIVFYILEKYKIDVITATISSDQFKSMLMIHTRASGVFDQYPEVASAVEEKYKRAVGEMIKSLSS